MQYSLKGEEEELEDNGRVGETNRIDGRARRHVDGKSVH